MTPFRGKLRTRHLEIILSVAELGNLSKAAEQLHMTQSGLSRAVAEVEEIVAGKLFERSAKGMMATALGAAMCRHAALLLSDFHKAEADLGAIARGDLGNMILGCFSMFSRWPLAEAILQFRQANPRVEITVEVGSHEALIEKLDTGAIDLLISRAPRSQSAETYRTAALVHDGIVLACAPDHPLARQDVDIATCVQYPWISAPPGSILREMLVHEIREAGLPAPEIVGALSLELGRELMSRGHFLWQLPESAARFMAARGEVCILPLSFNLSLGPLSAIWRRDRTSTRQTRSFILSLRRVVESSWDAGSH
ncbi:LysR family transcriptional regulator [Cupriavidus basilensis]|uniref:LysR family transcriptional regulator n=1 Tax=Cupriavidus basilensis TaxID=68895 RepID=UPI0039F721AB